MIGTKEKMSEKISKIKIIANAVILSISVGVAASLIFFATNMTIGIMIAPNVLKGFSNCDKKSHSACAYFAFVISIS